MLMFLCAIISFRGDIVRYHTNAVGAWYVLRQVDGEHLLSQEVEVSYPPTTPERTDM